MSAPAKGALRLGYGSNGFSGHRFPDACAVIAGLGYDGVALTLDQPHLDPFADDATAQTARVCLVCGDLSLCASSATTHLKLIPLSSFG